MRYILLFLSSVCTHTAKRQYTRASQRQNDEYDKDKRKTKTNQVGYNYNGVEEYSETSGRFGESVYDWKEAGERGEREYRWRSKQKY